MKFSHSTAGVLIAIAQATTAAPSTVTTSVRKESSRALSCPYTTALEFAASDPRLRELAHLKTCSLPLTIRATTHPNILEFEGEHGHKQYYRYPLFQGGALFLGSTFEEARRELLRNKKHPF